MNLTTQNTFPGNWIGRDQLKERLAARDPAEMEKIYGSPMPTGNEWAHDEFTGRFSSLQGATLGEVEQSALHRAEILKGRSAAMDRNRRGLLLAIGAVSALVGGALVSGDIVTRCVVGLASGCAGALMGKPTLTFAKFALFDSQAQGWEKAAGTTREWGRWMSSNVAGAHAPERVLDTEPPSPSPPWSIAGLTPRQKRELGEQMIREAEAAEAAQTSGSTGQTEKAVIFSGISVRKRRPPTR